jgi:hypothetical protein
MPKAQQKPAEALIPGNHPITDFDCKFVRRFALMKSGDIILATWLIGLVPVRFGHQTER